MLRFGKETGCPIELVLSLIHISNRLFDFFSYFFGNIAAGLPIAVVITCLFYGAICGSGPATVAAIGTTVSYTHLDVYKRQRQDLANQRWI